MPGRPMFGTHLSGEKSFDIIVVFQPSKDSSIIAPQRASSSSDTHLQ